jgi:nitroimidazol reductase NimA-like FMN-containing flavoprotein (pyridoxamine 5'-phosphate oxidase superfamily)
MTVSATFLDGLVLSLTPFHNSCNYRSAVVFGFASVVSSPKPLLDVWVLWWGGGMVC